MRSRLVLFLALAAGLATVMPSRPSLAMSRPVFNLSAGQTFGADGSPAGGGLSAAVSPMWPVGEHARFGVTLFVDDVGTRLGQLLDAHNGTDLGTAALLHRWAWGGAWRGDVDVARLRHWSVATSGSLGWWRVEDDVRGTYVAAASSVGVGLGAIVRRPVAAGQQLGLSVRWQRLFAERNASYRRTEQYATAALEWNWAGAARP